MAENNVAYCAIGFNCPPDNRGMRKLLRVPANRYVHAVEFVTALERYNTQNTYFDCCMVGLQRIFELDGFVPVRGTTPRPPRLLFGPTRLM